MKIKYINKNLPEQFFNSAEITIGREEDNSMQLLSDGISRHHGRIYLSGGNWYIEDLGSTNGIKLNGRKITAPEKLNENDIIDFYQEKLQVSDFISEDIPNTVFSNTETAKITISDVIQPDTADTASADPLIVAPAPAAENIGTISITPIAAADEPANNTASKKSDFDELTQFIKQNTGNLFNKNSKNNSSDPENKPQTKKFSNKLFYVILICAILVMGSFLIKILEDKNKPLKARTASVQVQDAPLYLNYIKENISADNVFRFNLTIENKTASFIVDDLKSQLRYGPIRKAISDNDLDRIKQAIKDSNFLTSPKVQPGMSSSNELEFKQLEVYYGKQSNTITLKNRPTPRDFMDIEDALTLFAENCNLATISISPEELKTQAESNFRFASDRLANYETNLGYLKEAIDAFNITIEYLSGISPEPEIRRQAVEKLKRAQNLRKNWITQYRSQYTTMLNKNDWEGAKNALQVLQSLYDENSKEYQVNKQRLIKLDMLRRRMKTRK
ncbi:MAG: FHA domain-containing protein [Lentisphaeria bacterium]|nr:FHA domain-containing protein [Lentisphaeria bacterium]